MAPAQPEQRAQDKREFAAACADFAEDHLLRAYSLVGTRGDCDLMIRSVSPSLDRIHELHVLLNQSGLMRFAEISHSYLAMTKESVYSDEPQPLEPRPGSDARYLIVYPMWKKREWYLLPAEERMRIMRGHIETGKRYSGIEINTAYSYGLDDQEFVVSFNADEPGEFLDLVQELRGDRVEQLHGVRDPDLHLHLGARRARAGCARRRVGVRAALGALSAGWTRARRVGAPRAASSISSTRVSFTRGRPWGSPAAFSSASIASQPA